MIRLAVILSCLLSLCTLEASLWDKLKGAFTKSSQPAPSQIKVLIVHDEPGALIEVKGKYRLFDPNQNEFISTRFIGKRKYMQPVSEGLKWGEEFPGVHQLLIVPDTLDITTLVDGIEYKGKIYVYDIGGSLSVVNEVTLEDYLCQTMSKQFQEQSPLPEETLNAFAIVARTDAYYLTQNAPSPFWAVDANLDTIYKGHARDNCPGIQKALLATRRMVLSETGAYEGTITAAPLSWGNELGGKTLPNQIISKISASQAEELGRQGKNASQILKEAFPQFSIQMLDN